MAKKCSWEPPSPEKHPIVKRLYTFLCGGRNDRYDGHTYVMKEDTNNG
jgi:hypothetical protein